MRFNEKKKNFKLTEHICRLLCWGFGCTCKYKAEVNVFSQILCCNLLNWLNHKNFWKKFVLCSHLIKLVDFQTSLRSQNTHSCTILVEGKIRKWGKKRRTLIICLLNDKLRINWHIMYFFGTNLQEIKLIWFSKSLSEAFGSGWRLFSQCKMRKITAEAVEYFYFHGHFRFPLNVATKLWHFIK